MFGATGIIDMKNSNFLWRDGDSKPAHIYIYIYINLEISSVGLTASFLNDVVVSFVKCDRIEEPADYLPHLTNSSLRPEALHGRRRRSP